MTGFLRDVLRWKRERFFNFSIFSAGLSLALFVNTLFLSSTAWAWCKDDSWHCAYENFSKTYFEGKTPVEAEVAADKLDIGTPVLKRRVLTRNSTQSIKTTELGKSFLSGLKGKEEILRQAHAGECEKAVKSLEPFCLEMSRAIKKANATNSRAGKKNNKEAICQGVRESQLLASTGSSEGESLNSDDSDESSSGSRLTGVLLNEFLGAACPSREQSFSGSNSGPCTPKMGGLEGVEGALTSQKQLLDQKVQPSPGELNLAFEAAYNRLLRDKPALENSKDPKWKTYCLNQEGIFRLSGDAEKIKEAVTNPASAPGILEKSDCNTAAAILKKLSQTYSPFARGASGKLRPFFLVKDPTNPDSPVGSRELREGFKKIFDPKDSHISESELEGLAKLISENTDEGSRKRLMQILTVLDQTVPNLARTKMTAENLAIVLAPAVGTWMGVGDKDQLLLGRKLDSIAGVLILNRERLANLMSNPRVRKVGKSESQPDLRVTPDRKPAVLPESKSRDHDGDLTPGRFRRLGEIQISSHRQDFRSKTSVPQAYEVKQRTGAVLKCQTFSYVSDSREIERSTTESNRLNALSGKRKKTEFKSYYVCHTADGTQVKLQANEIEGVREFLPKE